VGAALVACVLAVAIAARSRPREIACCALPVPVAAESGFVSAEIYFVPWDVLPTVAIPLARMREMEKQVVSDASRLDALVRRLQPAALRVGAEPPSIEGDYRLLVVLRRADGSEASYAATYFDVVDPATRRYRPIDDGFRAAFATGKW
jgi:hypothetical protein